MITCSVAVLSPLLLGYLVFFATSFGMLGLILAAALPSLIRPVRREIRLLLARRRREVRMLADLECLERDASPLEGLCLYSEPGPTSDEGGYAEADNATAVPGA